MHARLQRMRRCMIIIITAEHLLLKEYTWYVVLSSLYIDILQEYELHSKTHLPVSMKIGLGVVENCSSQKPIAHLLTHIFMNDYQWGCSWIPLLVHEARRAWCFKQLHVSYQHTFEQATRALLFQTPQVLLNAWHTWCFMYEMFSAIWKSSGICKPLNGQNLVIKKLWWL